MSRPICPDRRWHSQGLSASGWHSQERSARRPGRQLEPTTGPAIDQGQGQGLTPETLPSGSGFGPLSPCEETVRNPGVSAVRRDREMSPALARGRAPLCDSPEMLSVPTRSGVALCVIQNVKIAYASDIGARRGRIGHTGRTGQDHDPTRKVGGPASHTNFRFCTFLCRTDFRFCTVVFVRFCTARSGRSVESVREDRPNLTVPSGRFVRQRHREWL